MTIALINICLTSSFLVKLASSFLVKARRFRVGGGVPPPPPPIVAGEVNLPVPIGQQHFFLARGALICFLIGCAHFPTALTSTARAVYAIAVPLPLLTAWFSVSRLINEESEAK